MLEWIPVDWKHDRRAARTAALAFACGLAMSLAGAQAARAGAVEVFAELAVEGQGAVRGVRLFLDGVDVTDRSEVGDLRISYAAGDLAPGEHSARVVVTDALGRTVERSWVFEVGEDDPAPEVVAFFSDELFVELDALPGRVRRETLEVSGTTQPDAEIDVRADGVLAGRVLASASGRFSVEVDLPVGRVDLEVQARRPWTAEEGRSVRHRVERLASATLVEPAPREIPRPRPEAPQPDGPTWAEQPETPDLRVPAPREIPRPRPEAPPIGGPGLVDAPDENELREIAPRERVVITKPADGQSLVPDRVTVLGWAPPGWLVVVEVNARAAGEDVANPQGRFTVPVVPLEDGDNVLVALATGPDGERIASQPVRVRRESPHGSPHGDAFAVTLAMRGSRAIVRDGLHRLRGVAWQGAEVQVLLDGRLVAREIAGRDGRFDVAVPLARGPNHVVVEAIDPGSGRVVVSPLVTLLRTGTVRAGEGRRVLVERPGLPGGRLRGVVGDDRSRPELRLPR